MMKKVYHIGVQFTTLTFGNYRFPMAELHSRSQINVLFKQLPLDHCPVTDHQDEVCVAVFIHNLPHLLCAFLPCAAYRVSFRIVLLFGAFLAVFCPCKGRKLRGGIETASLQNRAKCSVWRRDEEKVAAGWKTSVPSVQVYRCQDVWDGRDTCFEPVLILFSN